MIRINPTKMVASGDQKVARNFFGPARSQLEILKNQMSFQNLSQGIRRVWLNEDVYVECRKIFNHQECRVWVRPLEEIEIITSFILIISSQSEQEAFAWDLVNNTILTDEAGDPMSVGTIDVVKAFVTEYIKRIEAENYTDVSNAGEIVLTQLEISGVIYDSWWSCSPGDSPGSYSGHSDIDDFNASPLVWPDTYKIDYSFLSSSDNVCVGDAGVISKLHHPIYYRGIAEGGQDPDFDVDAWTIPQTTKIGIGGTIEPLAEWMTPYIEYENPETGKIENKESSGIIRKTGEYWWENVPEEIHNRCGFEPDPVGAFPTYGKGFYWFASIFSADLRIYDHPTYGEMYHYATQQTLDLLTDFLYDSWNENCHVKEEIYDFYDPPKKQCIPTTWAHADFGKAENKNGAVVFDFCNIIWGADSIELTQDGKHRGAVSGEYSQIFRIYIHPKDELSGMAEDIFLAHNDLREREGLEKFGANRHLTEAAQAHATDIASHGMSGHIGSNGSTLVDRINNTDYLLWVKGPSYGGGENVAISSVAHGDLVATAMTGWENSPGHWSNIINEDYTEMGVGVASGIYNGDASVWFVVVFGYIGGKWAGFAQVDTINILDYMNTNFTWVGDPVASEEVPFQRRIPKLFLV